MMLSVILLSMLMILLSILSMIGHLICGNNLNWLLNLNLIYEMLGLTFSSKLDLGSYIISIAKTASKKIGALIRSMKFLSPTPMYGILLSRLGWCSQLLLRIVRQTAKMDMLDCWSFTCCFC